MTEPEKTFAADAATLELSNAFAAEAIKIAGVIGGDPAAALMGAALKVIEAQMGNEHVVPLAKIWLSTVIASEGNPTAYN